MACWVCPMSVETSHHEQQDTVGPYKQTFKCKCFNNLSKCKMRYANGQTNPGHNCNNTMELLITDMKPHNRW